MINLGKISINGKNIILEEKENKCLECVSHAKDNYGYTRIYVNGKHERLFRYLYEQKYGKIPKGMVVRHKCDNPSCCNVKHLEIGTQLDNINDMIIRNRHHKGKCPKLYGYKNAKCKLSKKDVCEIYLSNLSYKKLAVKYDISTTNVFLIKQKKIWGWLTEKF